MTAIALDGTGLPPREHFLVTIADLDMAICELRRSYGGLSETEARLEAIEATQELLDKHDLEPGRAIRISCGDGQS
ncbi:hypothetical protein ACRAVF_27380 [Bradyrhizobium oligotrophicum S58]